MATPADYTAVANALVKEINAKIATLSSFQQFEIRQYLTPDKINEVAGDGAKTAVDALDAYRATRNQTS